MLSRFPKFLLGVLPRLYLLADIGSDRIPFLKLAKFFVIKLFSVYLPAPT
jgi:hypothetical protein